MEKTVRDPERAKRLLDEITPTLLEILRDAPEYGQCGFDVVLHQGEITRMVKRLEETKRWTKR